MSNETNDKVTYYPRSSVVCSVFEGILAGLPEGVPSKTALRILCTDTLW